VTPLLAAPPVFDFSTGLVLLILGFGFLIFVHELGHFLAAKAVGIKVTQFAIGFGHAVLAFRKGVGVRVGSTEPTLEKRVAEELSQTHGDEPEGGWTQAKIDASIQRLGLGETEYRLNWIPLGGYVKMLGQEDLNPEAATADERSFTNKSGWARALVISAGVIMNLIFGAIFFIAAFMLGVALPPAVVGAVGPDGPAARATPLSGDVDDPESIGLRPGDEIVQIDDDPVTDFTDVRVMTALAAAGGSMEFHIRREGVDRTLRYRVEPQRSEVSGLLEIQVAPAFSNVVANSGDRGSVEPGMQLTAVAGEPVVRHDQYLDRLVSARGEPTPVTFQNQVTGETAEVRLRAAPSLQVAPAGDGRAIQHLLGFVPAVRVAAVAEGSPAAETGLRTGDVIARLGDLNFPHWAQLASTVGDSRGQPMAIEVIRDGERLDLGEIQADRNNRIGIYFDQGVQTGYVATTFDDAPAGAIDPPLPPGARLESIAGQPVDDFAQMQRLLQDLVDQAEDADQSLDAIEVVFALPFQDLEPVRATLTLDEDDREQIKATRWFAPPNVAFEVLRVPVAADDPMGAVWLGLHRTQTFMLQTYLTLGRLFQGSVPVNQLRGPVGIADEGARVAQQGLPYLLFFLGVISVNLAVINFLPIPIVDGGLMVFLIIEKIKGSPLSLRVQTAATVVGLLLIASVFLMTLFFDVNRIIG